MTEKRETMSRAEAERHLASGEHLAIAGRHVTHKRDLPERPAGAEEERGADRIEAIVARTADGRLTRAGMEHAIKNGGSVMHKGEVITDVDALPDETELVRENEAQAAALDQRIGDQIDALERQRDRLRHSGEERPTFARQSEGGYTSQARGAQASAPPERKPEKQPEKPETPAPAPAPRTPRPPSAPHGPTHAPATTPDEDEKPGRGTGKTHG